MNSYLLYKSNSDLRAFTDAFELQFQTSDPRGKIVQNVKFSSISQISDLISKLDPTCQHESRGMSVSKTKPQIPSYWKFTHTKILGLPWKIWFPTEARLSILRPSLNLWRQNESRGGLRSRFRVSVGPSCKTRQH